MVGVEYQVFARKYRPRTFDDVLGQDHVVRTLKNAISQNRLAHAYLFVGPRGTGKTSTSRIFAKALNCTGGPRVDFDPDEDVCVEIAEGRSLDVLEIDGASNNGVEQIRDLRESVHYAPARGQFRIYYIDEVHMLTANAFNALLKTLEEPPPHVKFIFATTEAHKILPTILSRCQRFDLRKIPAPLIAKHLQHICELEGVAIAPLAAHAIAVGADGGMRDAQSMLDQLVAFCGNRIEEQDVLDVFGFTSHQSISGMGDAILRGQTAEALDRIGREAEEGRDLARLLTDLIFHFRNVLVHQVDPEIAMRDLPPEMADDIAAQAAAISREKLLQLIDQFAETESSMKWALNKRLYMEIGIIRATQLLGESTLSDVILALRGGFEGMGADPAPRPEPSRAAASPARPAEAPVRSGSMAEAVRAAVGGTRPASAPAPVVSAPKPPEPEPARPAEPIMVAPQPAAAASAEPSVPGELDAAAWEAIRAEFARRAPLQGAFAAEAVFLGASGSVVHLGFPEAHAMAGQNLMRPNAKAVLEKTAQEVTGRHVQFKVEMRADLASQPLPEPSVPAAPPRAATPSAQPAPQKAPVASPEDVMAEFMNDPLIKEALQVFQATVLSDKP